MDVGSVLCLHISLYPMEILSHVFISVVRKYLVSSNICLNVNSLIIFLTYCVSQSYICFQLVEYRKYKCLLMHYSYVVLKLIFCMNLYVDTNVLEEYMVSIF